MKHLHISFSKASPEKYLAYVHWLHSSNDEIECIDLFTEADPFNALTNSDGFVLVGGEDVNPVYYGKYDEQNTCTIDIERDAYEFALIEEARRLNIPILGICRGMQIMNVALGGTLHIDLPSINKHGHGKIDGKDSTHSISIIHHTSLSSVVKESQGIVNSSHHQAVDFVAPLLKIAAQSDDGVIEALEWIDPEDKQYLVLVQWHPERMDVQNIFSKYIAMDFLEASKKFLDEKRT